MRKIIGYIPAALFTGVYLFFGIDRSKYNNVSGRVMACVFLALGFPSA